MKKQMSSFFSILMGVAMATGGLSGQAQAVSIGICDPDSPGNCDYSVTLDGNQLTMVLLNTSPSLNRGFITAVAFDLEGAASITGFTPSDPFFLTPSPTSTGDSINVAPDGKREFVISLDDSGNVNAAYEGGGSPTSGIAVGDSATFTLTLGADTFGSVTEANVLSSSLVRFRGFDDQTILELGSDKDKITNVPESASLMLLGAGLAGVGIWRRKATKV